jgi:hypothetical protein
MSSTSNVQAYLTSVFRPVYTYSSSNFATQLDLSNVNTVTANLVECLRVDVADPNSNVFVGTESGVNFLNMRASFFNTALGYAAGGLMSNVSNVVTVGYNAGRGISNTSKSVFIGNTVGEGTTNLSSCVWIDPSGGTLAGTSASNTIAIGSVTGIVGSGNIWIGAGAGNGNTGSNNILLGHSLQAASTVTSYSMLVGWGSNIVLSADLSQNALAIGKADASMTYNDGNGRVPGLVLDVSGYARIANGLAIGMDPLQSTLDVNGTFRADDGYGVLSLDHDSDGDSRVVVSAGLASNSAYLQSSGGFFSREGVSSNGSIGQKLRRGIIMIAIPANGCVLFWSGTGAPTVLGGSTTGMTFGGDGTISLTAGAYTVSYFPLPTFPYASGSGI